MCQVVFTVAGDGSHIETFDVVETVLAVPVGYVVNRPFVVALEHCGMDDFGFFLFRLAPFRFAHERFVADTDDFISSVAVENDGIVEIGTVGNEFVLFERCADKALFAVDVQFLVGFHHLGSYDRIEIAQFGMTRMLIAVFGFQHTEPVAGDFHHVVQVAVDACNLIFHPGDGVVGLVFIEFQDSGHFDVHQFEDIVLSHFPYHLRIERREPFVDVCAGRVHIFGLFEVAVFVNPLFDEYLFERGEMQAFLKFSFPDEQFLAEQSERVVH